MSATHNKLYLEDLVEGQQTTTAPFTISSDLVRRYVDLVGDPYEIHRDPDRAKELGQIGTIVPGSLQQALIGTQTTDRARPLQLQALRSSYIDFVRPLPPDQPVVIELKVNRIEVMTETTGVIEVTRRIMDEEGTVYTIARARLSVMRRPADAER